MNILLGIGIISGFIGALLIIIGLLNQILAKYIPNNHIEQENVREGYTTIPTDLLPDQDKLEEISRWIRAQKTDKLVLNERNRQKEFTDLLRKWAKSLRAYTPEN